MTPSGNPLNPFMEIPGDLAEENMRTPKKESLIELVERLDEWHAEAERVRYGPILSDLALDLHDKWPRISKAVRELQDFTRACANSDQQCWQEAKGLLASLDEGEVEG